MSNGKQETVGMLLVGELQDSIRTRCANSWHYILHRLRILLIRRYRSGLLVLYIHCLPFGKLTTKRYCHTMVPDANLSVCGPFTTRKR